MEEIKGILRHKTFGLVNVNDIMKRAPIFGPRLTDDDKTVCYKVRYKRRLVAQNYSYRDTVSIVTKAHTVHQFNQRPAFSTAAFLADNTYHKQDVTKAHTQ